jgi:metal-responsive CopG/Arc/MetJ family transcriptional regulator
MAKVLLSLPDEILKEIDEYRSKRGLKRNQFFMDAVRSYFILQKRDEYFKNRKKAVDNIRKTSKRIMDLDLKDWDPVRELRKARDERANELLKRWETD